MLFTPQSVLRTFILIALDDLGGSATKLQVLDRIDERFGSGAIQDDRRQPAADGAVKWENQAAWERNSMARDGLIAPYGSGDTTRGVWTLTAHGRAEASRLVELVPA